jgi:signal transduction histidine kinase
MRLNADEIAREGDAIQRIGIRARLVFGVLRGVMLLLAVAGVVLAFVASRQHIELVESSRGAAEARARELEMFAARVAHDLRAPLAVIEMRSLSAQRSNQLEALKEAVDRIGRQGRRMSSIIDALLEFAQAGARPEPGRRAMIEEVMDDIIADFGSIAGDAGIELVIERAPAAVAACSPSVLGIILSNLVHNAVKYIGAGARGARRIEIRTQSLGAAVRFEVEDTGPGLPPGSESIVFEPFVRASSSARGGIGLGLATVKRLVDAHGGQVGVVSSPGSGCLFWFELPAADDPYDPTSVRRANSPARHPAEGRSSAG